MQSNIYGKSSEIIAAEFLKNKGYEIIEMNYKNKIGEIDIIANDGDYIVFVEVKARMSRQFGDPLEAIDTYKQMKVRNVATAYLMSKKKMNAKCRFDAVGILGRENPTIRHIVNTF